MRFYKVRDVGGEFFDRYNVMFKERGDDITVEMFSMSHNADQPNGACYYDGVWDESDLDGTEIPFKALPHGLQVQIVNIERAYEEDLGGEV